MLLGRRYVDGGRGPPREVSPRPDDAHQRAPTQRSDLHDSEGWESREARWNVSWDAEQRIQGLGGPAKPSRGRELWAAHMAGLAAWALGRAGKTLHMHINTGRMRHSRSHTR